MVVKGIASSVQIYEVYQIRHHARGSSKALAVKKFPLKMHSEGMYIAKNQCDIWTSYYLSITNMKNDSLSD